MKIRIPKGEHCIGREGCNFLFTNGYTGHCVLFDIKLRDSKENDWWKCDKCVKDFDNGGEFEIIKKEV